MASPESPLFDVPSMLGPRSLAEICLKVAIDNIHRIKGLGTMASLYTNALLKAVKTASQLRALELNSDDIYDESAEHWKRFIKKAFPLLSTQHNLVPENRESWHKVYDQYQKLEAEQIAAATEKLTQRFAAHNEQKSSRTSTIISCEKFGKLRPGKAKRGYGAPREEQTFIKKTERQIRMEKTVFNLRRASDKVRVPAGQIKKAPQAMIEDARIRSQPPRLTQQLPSDTRAPFKSESELDREQMEARLRRVKNPAEPKAKTTGDAIVLSGDESDDLFGDLETGDDNLFGDHVPRNMATSTSSSSNKTPSLPLPANKQSAKRHLSTEETATEQPAKRLRPLEETAASTSSSPHKASSHMAPPATRKPVRARPKGLSAAPGANSVLRTYKPAPKTRATNNAPPRPFVAPVVIGQPYRSMPSTPAKTAAPPPAAPSPRPYPQAGPTTRVSRPFDGTVTPKKDDETRRIPLYYEDAAPHRRIRIMYPCRKLKPS